MLANIEQLFKQYSDKLTVWAVGHGLRVAVIIVIFAALFLVLRFAIKRFVAMLIRDGEEGSEKDKRVRTLSRVLSMTGGIVLVSAGLMMVVAELGIDIKPVLASLGVGGIALGFGAQSLVKDVISGFFILFENQIRVGDVVEAGGKSGLVESVGLRVLVLRDFAGNRIIIPNSSISEVVNMTYEYSRYVFDIGVAYKEDVDEVMKVIREVGEDLQKDTDFKHLIREPLEVFGVDSFGESAVMIKARITTRPIKQWDVGREFNRRLKIAFDRHGIEIPFPQRMVYHRNAEPSVT